MLIKVILVFLLAMALVGMLGKLLFPDRPGLLGRRRRATACRSCGKPLIGKGPCSCRGRR
ncbi:hypothetical protein [Xinfangfangia pollutisoli]|uniref:hypothetical protein n=1 Tax=Xinfangfangia pollutisoli TaxID=2865960 RepID=UPI001CD689C3|nr:hypothetical protein [Xinfangfangia pollutisoli]